MLSSLYTRPNLHTLSLTSHLTLLQTPRTLSSQFSTESSSLQLSLPLVLTTFKGNINFIKSKISELVNDPKASKIIAIQIVWDGESETLLKELYPCPPLDLLDSHLDKAIANSFYNLMEQLVSNTPDHISLNLHFNLVIESCEYS